MSRRGLRRLLILITAAFVLAAGVGVAWLARSRVNEARLEQARLDGMALYEAGDYDEALGHLGRYVARVKSDYDAIIAYAECQQKVPQPNGKHIRNAIAAARLAAELDPDRPRAHEMLLNLYASAGYVTELAETAGRLVELTPNNRDANALRVMALLQLSDIEAAEDAARGFLDRFPDLLEAHATYLEVLRARGADVFELLEYWQSDTVARSLGDRALYHVAVSRQAAAAVPLAQRSGDRDTYIELAVGSARRAAEITPIDQNEALAITSWLRQLAVMTADDSLAMLADERLGDYLDQQLFDDRHAAAESIEAWWRLDNEQSMRLAERIDPAGEQPSALGWRLFLATADDESLLDCPGCEDTLRAMDTPEAAAWRALAEAKRLTLENAEPAEVSAALEPVTVPELEPIAALLRGEVLRQSAQNDSAIVAFRRAAESGTTPLSRARATLALADALAERGDDDEARLLLTQLQRAGISGGAADAVATRYVERRLATSDRATTRSTATELLPQSRAAAQADPESPEKAALLARLLLLTDQIDEGLTETRRAVELGPPTRPMAFTSLAEVVEPHDAGLSRQLLDLVATVDTGRLQATAARAILAARAGRPDEGLALLEAFEPTDADEAERLALVRAELMDRFDLDGALEALAGLSEAYPDSPAAQTAVLDSKAAWSDESVVSVAIARLRSAAGEDSVDWRIASAKADLRFSETRPDADRQAELARITMTLLELRKNDPANPELLVLIADAYQQLGDAPRAISFLEEAAGDGPRAAAYPTLVRFLIREGRRPDAQEALDAFARASRVSDELRRERAELLERLGRPAEAVVDRRWLAEQGEPSDVYAYGRLLARRGETGRAREMADLLAPDADASPEGAQAAADILLTVGLESEAIATMHAALSGTLEPAETQRRIARMLIAHGRYAAAIKQLGPVLADGGDEATVMLLAHAALELGRPELAADAVESAAGSSVEGDLAALRSVPLSADGLDPTRLLAARLLAADRVSDNTGDTPPADIARAFLLGDIDETGFGERLAELSAENPGNENIWKSRVALADTMGAADESLADLLSATADALWNSAWPLERLAALHLSAGRLDEAEAATRALTDRLSTNTFAADILRARIAAARGDMSEAMNWLIPHRDRIATRGIAGDVALLASLYAAEGNPAEAERLLEAHMSTTPMLAWAYLDAVAFLPPSETETAERWLSRLDEIAGPSDRAEDRGWSWFRLSQASGRPEDAERALELLQLIPADELSVGVETLIAGLMEQTAEPEAVRQRYQTLADRYPDNPMIRNNFAYWLAGIDTNEAIAQAQEALDLARDAGLGTARTASMMHTLAVCQRAAGDQEAALQTLREALGLAGSSPELLIETAETLLELDRPAEARRQLSQVSEYQQLTASLRTRLADLREKLNNTSP